jgi:hypothetical protein
MPAVTVIGPLDPAWNGMKRILFKPFDMGNWFALGFSAWLATLGETGGSFNIPGSLGEGEGADAASQAVAENLGLVLVVASIAFIFVVAIAMVLVWASCRGKFMYIDNLVHDRALVAQPWREHKMHGNSLFLWTLGLGFVALILVGLVTTPIILGFAARSGSEAHVGQMTGLVALAIVAVLFVMLAVGIVNFIAQHCIVPVMKKRNLPVLAAWSVAKPHLAAACGPVVLYLLMRIAIAMAVGTAVMMFGFLTCCCGFLLLAIPYINAVILLPVWTFLQLYNLEFVRQLGPDFDLLPTEPPPAPLVPPPHP